MRVLARRRHVLRARFSASGFYRFSLAILMARDRWGRCSHRKSAEIRYRRYRRRLRVDMIPFEEL
jgi:hypothetical protein